MFIFTIIVTVGLIYAACVYEPNLLWFIGAATLLQVIHNMLWPQEAETKNDPYQSVMDKFFSDMRYSPWSKFFSTNDVKEKLQTTNEQIIKKLYQAVQNELKDVDNETYCKNLQFVQICICQEITNRQIEAYRHSRKDTENNYAKTYADSLEFPLTSSNLSDEEALKNAGQCSDADLVHVILDVPDQIRNTTAELTVGREEEMERYYHNNLRKIEYLFRLELAKRFLEKKD